MFAPLQPQQNPRFKKYEDKLIGWRKQYLFQSPNKYVQRCCAPFDEDQVRELYVKSEASKHIYRWKARQHSDYSFLFTQDLWTRVFEFVGVQRVYSWFRICDARYNKSLAYQEMFHTIFNATGFWHSLYVSMNMHPPATTQNNQQQQDAGVQPNDDDEEEQEQHALHLLPFVRQVLPEESDDKLLVLLALRLDPIEDKSKQWYV